MSSESREGRGEQLQVGQAVLVEALGPATVKIVYRKNVVVSVEGKLYSVSKTRVALARTPAEGSMIVNATTGEIVSKTNRAGTTATLTPAEQYGEGLIKRIELLAQGEFTDEWNKGYKQAVIDAARIAREYRRAPAEGAPQVDRKLAQELFDALDMGGFRWAKDLSEYGKKEKLEAVRKILAARGAERQP